MSQSCCSLDAPKNEIAHRLSGLSKDRGESQSRNHSDFAMDGVWQEGGEGKPLWHFQGFDVTWC